MKNRTGLALAALAALSSAAVIWFALAPVDVAPRSADESHEAHTKAVNEPATLESSDVARALDSAEPTAAARAELEQLPPFDMDGAIWIEGRVLFPSGTPADEHVEILADFDRKGSQLPHRVTVAANGTFRVAFPAFEESGRLELHARYLFLYEPHRLDLRQPPRWVELEPDIGGFLHAVLAVPPADEGRRGELVGTDLSITVPSGLRTANAPTFSRRVALIEHASHIDVGGLVPGIAYELAGDPKTFAPFELSGIRVEPGAVTNATIMIESGVDLRGRVIDEAAHPIAGARFGLMVYTGNETTYDSVHSVSRESGAFELRGVRAGKIRLTALAEGYLATHVRIDEPRAEPIEIVLRRGRAIRGRVEWPDHTPAAGASLELDLLSAVGGRDQFEELEWDGAPQQVAAADGSFEFTGLTEGPFMLLARATAGDRSGFARLDTVKSDGEPIALSLDEGRAIRGRVIDETGAPVPRFTITATPAVRDEAMWLVESATGRSSGDGSFVVEGMRTGAWAISVKGPGGIVKRDVTVPSDDAIEIVLPRPAAIAGRVVDPDGQPVRGARVSCVPKTMPGAPEEQRFTANATGADGRFMIEAVASGPSNITASHFRFATSETETFELPPGQALTNLVIPLRHGGRITGEVLDAENRPDPMRVLHLSPRGGRTQISARIESDATGRFAVEGVPPGDYTLRTMANAAERELGRDAASNVSQRASVTVVAGQTSDVTIGGKSRASVRVAGRVAASDRGVAGATISANGKNSSKRAQTDVDGRYEMLLDEPGSYSFSFVVGDIGTRVTRQVEIPEAARATVDFDLPGARIAGRVVTPKGEPARQVEVELRSDTWDAAPSTLRSPFGHVFTGEDGRFAFGYLFAGTYTLRANEAIFLGTDQVAQFSPTSVELVLEKDVSIEDVEMRLEPAATLDVEVREAGGRLCAGADVFVFDESGKSLVDYTSKSTDAAGRQRVNGLPLQNAFAFARKGTLVSAVAGPVRIGETELVNLELRPGTMLVVEVDTPAGTRPVQASVRDERGIDFAKVWSRSGGAIFVSSGRTSVGPLPPGRYRVDFAEGSASAVDVVVAGEATREVKLAMPAPPKSND